jgi:hypothetical protein
MLVCLLMLCQNAVYANHATEKRMTNEMWF